MPNHTTLDATTGAPLGEISQAPPALEIFLDKHQMKIIVLAILLAIAAVIFVILRGIDQSNEESAGALLTKAEDLSDLQAVVKNYDDTKAAFSAKVLLADKQWEDGQQDDAIATLKAFVESERSHPARPSAEASLAAKLWSQGKADEAETLFRSITEDTEARYLAPYAWISIGDIEAAKGNTEAAQKAYETVESEFAGTTYAGEAVTRRLLVKAKPPVEIEAPVVVPDANLTNPAADGAAEVPLKDASVEDLLKAVKDGAAGADANPLLPQEEPSEPTE